MIVFNDAQTLSVSRRFDYLGEANLNYRKVNNFSVKGRFISNNSSDGFNGTYFGVAYVEDSGIWYPFGSNSPIVTGASPELSGYLSFSGGNAVITLDNPDTESIFGSIPSPLYDIWEEMDNLKDRFADFQEIVLNGVSLGSGRVLNFAFPKNSDPRQSEFSVEFETYHSGDLSNWTGSGYANSSINPEISKYVSSMNESFDFEFLKDGSLSFSRSLDFDMISSGWNYTEDITKAKSFASGIFHGDPAFSVLVGQYPNFYQESGARIINETYNAILGSYSFSETFQGPTDETEYYWTNQFSLTIDPESGATVSEKGNIQGVKVPTYDSALIGLSQIESTSKSRAEDFYYGYASGCADELYLKESSKTVDRFAGTIEYNFEYLNDPFSSGCYTVVRSVECQQDDNGIFTISENGSVSDRCGGSGMARLQNSINYFNDNISGDVFGRIYSYYTGQTSGCGCDGGAASTGDLRIVSRENGYSEFNGLFDYAFVYRNDCTSLVDECYLVTVEKEVNDTIHNVFLDVTINSGEVSQRQNTSSLIKETQRISVVGQCPELDIDDYLAVAINKVSPPTGSTTYYMENANYLFDGDNSRFELSVFYNYTGYRPYTNINV